MDQVVPHFLAARKLFREGLDNQIRSIDVGVNRVLFHGDYAKTLAVVDNRRVASKRRIPKRG
jgi:hypothetical protein